MGAESMAARESIRKKTENFILSVPQLKKIGVLSPGKNLARKSVFLPCLTINLFAFLRRSFVITLEKGFIFIIFKPQRLPARKIVPSPIIIPK